MATATDTVQVPQDEYLALLVASERAEFAPGRINNGRQASFDAVAAWNSVGRID